MRLVRYNNEKAYTLALKIYQFHQLTIPQHILGSGFGHVIRQDRSSKMHHKTLTTLLQA